MSADQPLHSTQSSKPASDEKQVFSLYAISKGLKDAINAKFGSRTIWIRAEIAEINFHRSGHAYLELADNEDGRLRAQARAMIWASSLEKIQATLGKDFDNILKKGSQLQCLVRVDYHLLYGLRIEIVEVDATFNLGLLEKRKQETIRKLKQQGILRKNGELQLPAVVQSIALVGSPETSGYRDFVKQLLENEYGYRFHIDTFPTTVQGEHANNEIIKALQAAEASDSQAIVLIRGGGSKLDLEVFNDFQLALEITKLTKPVFTGIGHETDWSVADMVAHTAVKTPTAVAAFLLDRVVAFESKVIDSFQRIYRQSDRLTEWTRAKLEKSIQRFQHASSENIQRRTNKMDRLAGKISRHARFHLEKESSKQAIRFTTLIEKSRHLLIKEQPALLSAVAGRIGQFSLDQLRQNKIEVTANRDRLRLTSRNSLQQKKRALEHYRLSLKLVHPDQVLKLGYGISRIDGLILTPETKLTPGQEIETEFINRKITSTVKEVKEK